MLNDLFYFLKLSEDSTRRLGAIKSKNISLLLLSEVKKKNAGL